MTIEYKPLTDPDNPLRSPVRWGILIAVALIQAVLIVKLYPLLHTRVFALTLLVSISSGLLFGKVVGVIGGAAASFVTFGAHYYLGFPMKVVFAHGAFGIPLNAIIGLGFGVLHSNFGATRRATQSKLIAEERQENLEQQLLQSQKMEAIGTLAGGVAHDMNNILGIIMSSASLLKHSMKEDDPGTGDVTNILDACRRGRDLTRNLLGFARKGTYVKDIIDLNDIVMQSKNLLTPVVSKNIRIVTELDGALYQIYGDRSQIEQALMNICINAAEAISATGTILLSTWNCSETDAHLIEEHGLYSGDYAAVQVKDTGSGIDEETLRHVFEPFYTTKQPGEGTGLGLSMAYGTIKNHGGGIDVKSEPGKGTTITLFLPALVSEQRVKVQRRISTMPSPPVGRSILLVDDEAMIRTANKRLLGRLGYEVLLAESGEQAIQIYRESAAKISLIILDYVMPGMDGAETFTRIKELNPNAKIVISSGYSKDGDIERLLERGAVGFLQKPFDIEQIGEMLAELPRTGTFPAVKVTNP